MTWQDELQQLDADLAAGRISAEDYRTRRDAALGRAQSEQAGFPQQGPQSGGFPQQNPQSGGFPQQAPPSGGFPQQNPQSGGFPQQGPQSGGFPQQQNPFPPAFNWGQAGQQQGAPQQPAQPSGDSDSTQVVNVNQVQQSAPPNQGGFSQQQGWNDQQSPWGAQNTGWNSGSDTGTPWDNGDLPATDQHGDTSWMRQGPEVFEDTEKSGNGKLIAGLSIGAVLIVGLVVAGIFYFTSSGGSTDEQAGPQNTEQPAPAPTPELPAPPAAKPTPATSGDQVLVPPPPGTPHPFNGMVDRAALEGPRGGLLPQAVRDSALDNGVVDAWFHGTDGATPKTTLIALRMPDQNAATALTQTYLDGQTGLSTLKDLSYQGVSVVGTGGGTYRTAYTSHNWVVIVDVSAPSDQADAAKSLFTEILDQQLNQSPPTVLK